MHLVFISAPPYVPPTPPVNVSCQSGTQVSTWVTLSLAIPVFCVNYNGFYVSGSG